MLNSEPLLTVYNGTVLVENQGCEKVGTKTTSSWILNEEIPVGENTINTDNSVKEM